jgi:protein-S-isoprenylcysteine O-methyltransferase Ste14
VVEAVKHQLYFFDVVAFVLMATALWAALPASRHFYAGMGLATVALVFWVAARLQLGESFAVGAKAHKLVTTGFYAKFRNPVYLFAQVAYLGLAIAWGAWPGFLFVAMMWMGQMMRAKKEAAVLEKAFGDEYRAYRARTWL